MLYNKWWRKDTNQVCPKTNADPSKASALNVVNIGGVFVVLFCGLTFAVLVAIAEYCWTTVQKPNFHLRDGDLSLSVKSSFWVQIYTNISLLFFGQEEKNEVGNRVAVCSSCQAVSSEGDRIKYI